MRMTSRPMPFGPHLISLCIATALAACGGGGGSEPPPNNGGGGGGGGGTSQTTTTFKGVAATGEAMAGASVTIKCKAGTGNVVAAADGSYTLALADATLPCVAQATSADGKVVLHALADPAGGTTQTLNVNPLTELITAKVVGGLASSFYAGFDMATSAKITATGIADAITNVVGSLKTAGVDFSSIGQPMTAPLVAKTATSTGNAYDQALDLLGQQLTQAGTSLAQLAAALAAPPVPGTVGLTPTQLLQPASTGCLALRSGTYRWIVPSETEAAWRASKAEFDAVTTTMTWQDGSKSTGTALGGCAFAADGGKTRLVVSQAGVIVSTSVGSNGQQVLSIGFPEQAAQLADLAGTWNFLEFNRVEGSTTSSFVNDFTVAEFAADGRHTALSQCDGLSACVAYTSPLGTLKVNASGGFDYLDASGTVTGTRFFLLRLASGERAMIGVDANGSVLVGAPQSARALPAVGTVSSRWDTTMNVNGVTAAFSEATYTVNAIDTAAQTYTRTTQANGVVNVFSNNKPRNGLIYRAPGTTTNNAGATVNVSEIITLRLPGAGLVVYGRITTETNRNAGFFGVGIDKPDGATGTTSWPPVASSGGPTITSMSFSASPTPQLVVNFSEPMAATFYTTGSYVPASSVWETSTRFVITFSSYSPGGFITLKAPTAADPRGFVSAGGTGMSADVSFQFP